MERIICQNQHERLIPRESSDRGDVFKKKNHAKLLNFHDFMLILVSLRRILSPKVGFVRHLYRKPLRNYKDFTSKTCFLRKTRRSDSKIHVKS